jgi:16S rRNA (cytidine1402-2'-O)-methyltransferase
MAGSEGITGDSSPRRALSGRPPVALYLVGTPIGNLEDITLRALRILREVDLIACEDTRHTQKLLNHFQIATRTTSYHDHNEFKRAEELVHELEQGKAIALVTDAGMPGISDPGFRLITLALGRQIPVIPIPGPSAFLTALAASGVETDSFRFHGFLPSKTGQRRQILEQIKLSRDTEVFYESPHRLLEALEDIVEVLGPGRGMVIARELTKIHEEFIRGTTGEVSNAVAKMETVRGEITLIIARAQESAQTEVELVSIPQRIRQIMAEKQTDEKAALKVVAKERGISKSEVYRRMQSGRK